MRREPSLTFEGALRILGQHEHKTIEKIDKLLGGVILGSGAVTGAVAPRPKGIGTYRGDGADPGTGVRPSQGHVSWP